MAGTALLDPGRGAARRAKVRDKAISLGHAVARGVRGRMRDLKWRTRGRLHELKARLQEDHVADDILEARVRAHMGRPVSHPGALHVKAHDGNVEVSGTILAREVQDLIGTIRTVRGVKGVINRLDIRRAAERIPSLQGVGSRLAH
jgi:osmotically-inducible protein OsmY